jgi:hypothetical protein
MATPLKKPQMRSSISRFLNAEALERANAPLEEPAREEIPQEVIAPKPKEAAPRSKVVPISAPKPVKTKSREFLLTLEQDAVLDELVSIFRTATGTRTTASHVLLATLSLLSEHIPAIRREVEKIGPLHRPANQVGYNSDEWKEFEQNIEAVLKAGLRG